jgi:hypothetical protein
LEEHAGHDELDLAIRSNDHTDNDQADIAELFEIRLGGAQCPRDKEHSYWHGRLCTEKSQYDVPCMVAPQDEDSLCLGSILAFPIRHVGPCAVTIDKSSHLFLLSLPKPLGAHSP